VLQLQGLLPEAERLKRNGAAAFGEQMGLPRTGQQHQDSNNRIKAKWMSWCVANLHGCVQAVQLKNKRQWVLYAKGEGMPESYFKGEHNGGVAALLACDIFVPKAEVVVAPQEELPLKQVSDCLQVAADRKAVAKIVIQGKMGAGKSAIIAYIARHFTQDHWPPVQRAVVFAGSAASRAACEQLFGAGNVVFYETPDKFDVKWIEQLNTCIQDGAPLTLVVFADAQDLLQKFVRSPAFGSP